MTLTQRFNQIATLANYQDITNNALVEILGNYTGSAQFSAFRGISKREDLNKYDAYFIEVNGKKKKNPNAVANPFFEGGIINYAEKINIVTGFDYVNSVEGRMKREGIEGEFEGGTSWHRAISRALSVHKNDENRFYFRYQYLDNSNQLLEHYHQNDQVAYHLFSQFLQQTNHYGIQKRHGLQDTCNIQVMAISNILTIHIDKHKFRLVENIDRLQG